MNSSFMAAFVSGQCASRRSLNTYEESYLNLNKNTSTGPVLAAKCAAVQPSSVLCFLRLAPCWRSSSTCLMSPWEAWAPAARCTGYSPLGANYQQERLPPGIPLVQGEAPVHQLLHHLHLGPVTAAASHLSALRGRVESSVADPSPALQHRARLGLEAAWSHLQEHPEHSKLAGASSKVEGSVTCILRWRV